MPTRCRHRPSPTNGRLLRASASSRDGKRGRGWLSKYGDGLHYNPGNPEKWCGWALGGEKFFCSTEFCGGNMESIERRQPKGARLGVCLHQQGNGRSHILDGSRKELFIQEHFLVLTVIQSLGQHF